MKVDYKARTKAVKAIAFPKQCPVCGYNVGKFFEEDVAVRCLNGFNCSAQLKESVRYFCSRQAFNIENIGPSLIDQLIENKLISNPSDLFALKIEDLINLDRMGEKSAQNVVDAIKYAKDHISYPKILTALGIPLMGSSVAKLIAQETQSFKSFWEKYVNANALVTLNDIHGVGPKLVDSIENFFRHDYAQIFIQGLLGHGINPKSTYSKTDLEKLVFNKKVFCISGTLSISRDKIKEKIESLGGKVSSSISSKTDYLLAGEKVGQNKLTAAKKYNTQIINEQAFNDLLK